ncbi:MAG: hypothetical protein ABI147_13275 [Acidobacteriaceae bacterium]
MPNNEAQMEVPDEYLREIGRILVCWNSLEHMLDAALIVALSGKNQDPDGRASAIFAHMAIDQKINALESMLRLIDKTPNGMGDIFKDTVRPILKQCKEKRNGIVHHFWTGHNGIVHKSNIQARGKLKVVSAKVPIQELVEVSELISRGRTALQDFCLERFMPAMAAPQQGQ